MDDIESLVVCFCDFAERVIGCVVEKLSELDVNSGIIILRYTAALH